MDARALLTMLAVGAAAGVLAGFIIPFARWGWPGTILVGIIGGVVGGWLLNVAKVNFNLGHPIANSIATSAIGAIVVIFLARLLAG